MLYVYCWKEREKWYTCITHTLPILYISRERHTVRYVHNAGSGACPLGRRAAVGQPRQLVHQPGQRQFQHEHEHLDRYTASLQVVRPRSWVSESAREQQVKPSSKPKDARESDRARGRGRGTESIHSFSETVSSDSNYHIRTYIQTYIHIYACILIIIFVIYYLFDFSCVTIFCHQFSSYCIIIICPGCSFPLCFFVFSFLIFI